MSNTATRLFTLIMLLQRQPNQKAADLAEQLGVSVRSLHRYFAMLDEMGIPIYSERGPHGGFSLVRGYKMPPLIFSPEEATAICLGAGMVGDLWGQLYDEAARSALAKIENVLPADQMSEVNWARRTLVTARLQRERLGPFAPWLGILRSAIRARQQVRVTYQASSQTEALERDFNPYALAYRQGWWYAIGYCHLREAIRSFRIDRIRALEPLTTPYEIPPDFDVHAYLAFEIQSEQQVHIRLRLAPEVAHLALSTPSLWVELEPQPDQSVIVGTDVPNIFVAAALTLSYGPAATVLEPEALRQMVRDWAAEVVRMYGG